MTESDPIRQSGFGGGATRWRQERESILDLIDSDGDFLDVGCANGYLLECLVKWGSERGKMLIPYGLDCGKRLIELARKRYARYARNFFIGNGWDWIPPRRFKFVYTLYDCVPPEYLEEYLHRLILRYLSEDGCLILGAYGSASENKPPFDISTFLNSKGFEISGTSTGGSPIISSFARINKR